MLCNGISFDIWHESICGCWKTNREAGLSRFHFSTMETRMWFHSDWRAEESRICKVEIVHSRQRSKNRNIPYLPQSGVIRRAAAGKGCRDLQTPSPRPPDALRLLYIQPSPGDNLAFLWYSANLSPPPPPCLLPVVAFSCSSSSCLPPLAGSAQPHPLFLGSSSSLPPLSPLPLLPLSSSSDAALPSPSLLSSPLVLLLRSEAKNQPRIVILRLTLFLSLCSFWWTWNPSQFLSSVLKFGHSFQYLIITKIKIEVFNQKQHTAMYERNVLGPRKSNGEMFSSDLRGTDGGGLTLIHWLQLHKSDKN